MTPRTSARPSHRILTTAIAFLGFACHSDNQQQSGQTAADAAGAGGQPAATAAAVHMIDRSGLTDVGTDQPLDYSDPNLWLCRPGNQPNECDRNLDVTELLPDGTRKLEPHVTAQDPAFDCFYVYPTVKLTDGVMTDFSNIDITLDALLNQAGPFTSICRMYAPLYRQAGVTPTKASMGGPSGTDFSVGQQDVRDAFKYYLDHLSQGRKFVIMGHSQGAGMIMGMIAQDIDPNPELRARLISALPIGGGFTVPQGQTVGGTFKNIPICTQPGQVGCVIAYSSFAADKPPMSNMLFASFVTGGMQLACTEPAMLANNNGGTYKGSYVPMMLVNPALGPDGSDALPKDIATHFVVYRNVFSGACKMANGYSYLDISLKWNASDPRPMPPYRNAAAESVGFGLHLVDYAIEMDDLIDAVKLQAAAAH